MKKIKVVEMSSNFVRFQKIQNQAFAENFICLSQKLVNPLFYLSSYFLLHIMALPVVEFSRQGYKIGKAFA
jgi:hypothetical protein